MTMREAAIEKIDDAFCRGLEIASHCAVSAEQVLVWDDGDVTKTTEMSTDTRHFSGDKEVEVIKAIGESHCDCDYCTEWKTDKELQRKYSSKEAYIDDVIDSDFAEMKNELQGKIENIPKGYFVDEVTRSHKIEQSIER